MCESVDGTYQDKVIRRAWAVANNEALASGLRDGECTDVGESHCESGYVYCKSHTVAHVDPVKAGDGGDVALALVTCEPVENGRCCQRVRHCLGIPFDVFSSEVWEICCRIGP